MSESEIARRKVFVVEIPTEVWVELRTEITMLMLPGCLELEHIRSQDAVWLPDGTMTDDAQAVFNRATDKVEGVMEECGLVRTVDPRWFAALPVKGRSR
tara:strand:+ start:618 stop:914 length:297 start_codon:yes stop_codon:yes gene_type:complete